jgi:hypothetical protein
MPDDMTSLIQKLINRKLFLESRYRHEIVPALRKNKEEKKQVASDLLFCHQLAFKVKSGVVCTKKEQELIEAMRKQYA